MGVTWPKYPAVPDSMSGTPPAWHSLLTCLRASAIRIRSKLGTTTVRRRWDSAPPLLHGADRNTSAHGTAAVLRIAKYGSLTHVIQRIHHQPKTLYPLQVVLRLLDIAVSRMDLDAAGGVEVPRRGGRNERLGLGYVRLAKQELAVQVGQVDRVQVDLASAWF